MDDFDSQKPIDRHDPINAGRTRLNDVFARQRLAFAKNRYPSLEQRIKWLDRFEEMLRAYRVRFQNAVKADFGYHTEIVTDLYETGAVIARVRYFKKWLPEWIGPSNVELSPKIHGSATAKTIPLPRGVVGNISPWNFPVECALVMVADMLAAGNRVILKPASQTKQTSCTIQEAVNEFFDDDVLACVTGKGLTEYFPTLPWDHLTFTGSPRIGRLIMRAAAENLVPVTLELGGKNPAVFAEDGIDSDLIRIFLESRILKGGQVCIAPDYVFVPRAFRDEWINRAKSIWSELYPKYVGHPDATAAIDDSHYNRVVGYADEARSRGFEVISLNGDLPNPTTRQIPMLFIVEPDDSLACMQDEIFGPVTPICCYDNLDAVIAKINSGPAPLASYLATQNNEVAERFVKEVRSGGTGVNNFGTQAGHPGISFGGVGNSGMGCHSGHQGFLNYSHVKGVFRGDPNSPMSKILSLPYGEAAKQLASSIFRE